MESKKKMLFIFNPFSGKAQIKSKLFEIIDVFVKGGYEVSGSRCLQRGRRNTG